MASKVMASSSPAASDLNRSSIGITELQSPVPSRATMNMDDLLKSFWPADPDLSAGVKTVDQVWKEITGGPRPSGAGAKDRTGEMTLEDFLAKAGVVRDEDVTGDGGFGASTAAFSGGGAACSGDEAFGKRFGVGEEGEDGPRAKRKAAAAAVALSEPVDRAAQQRQRRMIKNRESAARSRERKMAYTQDLKEAVSKLEEENMQLVNEQKEQKRRRYKHIMTYVIPVVEGRKPRRALRRTRSMQW